MNQNIVEANSSRCATLSMGFCIVNGIPMNEETLDAVTGLVVVGIIEWYTENGKSYKPDEELLEEDAIRYSFGKLQDMVSAMQLIANMRQKVMS